MHSVIIKILTVLVKREKRNKQEDRAEERKKLKINRDKGQRHKTRTKDNRQKQKTRQEI